MKHDPLEGWRLTQAIAVMIAAARQAGNQPDRVLMHPDDFNDIRDEDGRPWTKLEISGLRIDLDPTVEPGKIRALNPARNGQPQPH